MCRGNDRGPVRQGRGFRGRERPLFISHAWEYSEQYPRVVGWLNAEPNLSWRNLSVPEHDSVDATDKTKLKERLTAQIRLAQAVIILSGMYAAHRDWIEYQIDEAVRMGKVIIGSERRGRRPRSNVSGAPPPGPVRMAALDRAGGPAAQSASPGLGLTRL